MSRTFIYRILPPRADFAATLSSDEAETMSAHFDYLTALNGERRVIFVGRAENGDFGLVVYRAADLLEARAIAEADPAVASGLMRVEVHEFRVVDFG
jgi:uncharacterized protein YciI